ncbi:MAG: hypothetical protein ACOX6D_02635 [Thermoguttaceae bacterium]|jgi:hypothetical protein
MSESASQTYTAEDGRKMISVTNAGTSVTLETTEQAARGTQATAEAEMAQIKLHGMKRGLRAHVWKNPGPIVCNE